MWLALPGQSNSNMRMIWDERAGGDALLLALKWKDLCVKELSGLQEMRESATWLTTRKETEIQAYIRKELNSAKNVSVPGSRFC